MADFEKLGATVVGISPDDLATLARFQKSAAAPQRFVSDPDLRFATAYGAKMTEGGDTFAKRQTFVIGANGKILLSVLDWSPLSNVNKVYAWLKVHPQH
ncbi:MAG: redoxin domain-containing protein [Candidatus Eremiobacteraeota bacterium]|nr:redoxin domain-containing protein [Candidatus Eremiobacteraeota bacterium]